MLPRTRYKLFLDESGTHDMRHVDRNFPVFVLLGLLVGESYYVKTLVPRIKRLKFRHFGTKDIVLHSYDIRKQQGPFSILSDHATRSEFYSDINALFANSRFRLYAVAIHKARLAERFLTPLNPYDVSLSQLLSVVCGPPRVVGANRPVVSEIIAESRGRVEDKELQREYQQFRQRGLGNYGANDVQSRKAQTVKRLFPSKIEFVRKRMMVGGLELADLAAYPIARAVVKRSWENLAAQVLLPRVATLIEFP